MLYALNLYSEGEVAQLCPTLCDPMDCSPPGFCVHGILRPWDSPGKNTGVGHHFLLQGNVVGPGDIAKTKTRKSNKQMDAKQKKDFNHFQV